MLFHYVDRLPTVVQAFKAVDRADFFKIEGYVENIVTRYPPEFRKHFRISRDACDLMLNELRPHLTMPMPDGIAVVIIPAEKQLLMFCWYMANQDCFRQIEMMVPYKGTRAGNLRQYIRSKPHKWGFKLFTRAGVSGIVYDFIAYAGKTTFRPDDFTDAEMKLGQGAQLELELYYYCVDQFRIHGIRRYTSIPSSPASGITR